MRLDKKYKNIVPKYMKPKNINVSPSLNKAMSDVNKYSIFLVIQTPSNLLIQYLASYKLFTGDLPPSFFSSDCQEQVFIKKDELWYNHNNEIISQGDLIKYLDGLSYLGFKNKHEYNKYIISRELQE